MSVKSICANGWHKIKNMRMDENHEHENDNAHEAASTVYCLLREVASPIGYSHIRDDR